MLIFGQNMSSWVNFGWKPTITAIFVGIRNVGWTPPTTSLRNRLLRESGKRSWMTPTSRGRRHSNPIGWLLSLAQGWRGEGSDPGTRNITKWLSPKWVPDNIQNWAEDIIQNSFKWYFIQNVSLTDVLEAKCFAALPPKNLKLCLMQIGPIL